MKKIGVIVRVGLCAAVLSASISNGEAKHGAGGPFRPDQVRPGQAQCVNGVLDGSLARAVFPIGPIGPNGQGGVSGKSDCLMTAISGSVGVTAAHCIPNTRIPNAVMGGVTLFPSLVESIGVTLRAGDPGKFKNDPELRDAEMLTHDIAFVQFPEGTFSNFMPYSNEDETLSKEPAKELGRFGVDSNVTLVHFDHLTGKMSCKNTPVSGGARPLPGIDRELARQFDGKLWEIEQTQADEPVLVGLPGDSGGPMIDHSGRLRGVQSGTWVSAKGKPFCLKSYFVRMSSPLAKLLVREVNLHGKAKMAGVLRPLGDNKNSLPVQLVQPFQKLDETSVVIYRISPDLSRTRIEAQDVRIGMIYIVAFLNAQNKPEQPRLRRFTVVEQPSREGENGRVLSEEIPIGEKFLSSELGWDGDPFEMYVSRIEGNTINFKKSGPVRK